MNWRNSTLPHLSTLECERVLCCVSRLAAIRPQFPRWHLQRMFNSLTFCCRKSNERRCEQIGNLWIFHSFRIVRIGVESVSRVVTCDYALVVYSIRMCVQEEGNTLALTAQCSLIGYCRIFLFWPFFFVFSPKETIYTNATLSAQSMKWKTEKKNKLSIGEFRA